MKMTTDEFDEILESMEEPKKVWLTTEEARIAVDACEDLAYICRVVGNLDDEIRLLETRNKLVRRLENVENKDD